jgi:hypothetical protein
MKKAALLFFAVCMFLSCTRQKIKNEEVIAVVGDRIITTDEFIRRAEYTIRPPYCKTNSSLEKKIILNSIIAEKLFAFEAGSDNPLAQSKAFRAFVRGRKEQIMRQVLYHEVIKGKAKPEAAEFEKRYKLAGRSYRLAYLAFDRLGAELADQRRRESSGSDFFDGLYREWGGLGAPPEKVVSWKSRENPIMHSALFTEPLQVGQVVGPFRVERDQYIMVKVLGLDDQPALTDLSVRWRSQAVTEELEQEKGGAVWDQHVWELMKGKRMEFQKGALDQMVGLMKPVYLPEGMNREHGPTLNFPDQGDISSPSIDSVMAAMGKDAEFADRPFFTFDGKTWTVAGFFGALASHPLVFRKRKIGENEFAEQFKLAVADLMRDQIVNQEAYDRGIDQLPHVKAHTDMWSDALLAEYEITSILRSKGAVFDEGEEYAKRVGCVHRYLNSHTDSLFKKYSTKIKIHIPNFEKIKLTRIDMFVLNQNAPYLDAVPAFPLITTRNSLAYGRKLE